MEAILIAVAANLPRRILSVYTIVPPQQPVVHTDFLRMATRAGLGRIKRSVVAGPGIESR